MACHVIYSKNVKLQNISPVPEFSVLSMAKDVIKTQVKYKGK